MQTPMLTATKKHFAKNNLKYNLPVIRDAIRKVHRLLNKKCDNIEEILNDLYPEKEK